VTGLAAEQHGWVGSTHDIWLLACAVPKRLRRIHSR
jgi:hypothetical protein